MTSQVVGPEGIRQKYHMLFDAIKNLGFKTLITHAANITGTG